MAAIVSLVQLILFIAILAGIWQIFEKAGEAGWKSLIPIYNIYVLAKIIGKPIWFWLLLIPFVNIFIFVAMHIRLAKCFGKSAIFGIGLILLPFVCFPMLGFSQDAQYRPVQS